MVDAHQRGWLMRIKWGRDAHQDGRRCASGRETTAVVCKKHRSGFVKPPRWFSQTTALLSRFAYEPSPSALSPLPVPFGLSSRFVDVVPSRSCAPRLPRLPTCRPRQAHHCRPAFAIPLPILPITTAIPLPNSKVVCGHQKATLSPQTSGSSEMPKRK